MVPPGTEPFTVGYLFPVWGAGSDVPVKGLGRSQRYLADADVLRWYQNVARGANSTADNYLRMASRLLESSNQTFHGIIQMKPQKRDDFMADLVQRELDRGLAGSTVAFGKKALASWLEWNGKRLNRRIRIPGVADTPALRDAYIPAQDDLRRVLDVADARARTAVCLMAHSGLRPEVLGAYRGDNGLRLRDLPELEVAGAESKFKQIPTIIQVPAALSKIRTGYMTMLGREGCQYLLSYLRERIEAGETLSPDSPVIRPRKVAKPFIRTINISDIIRKPMRAAGIKLRPYIWRSYFDHQAMQAEREGLLRDYRQFFMGHRGDIETVYTLRKRIPAATIERMRQAYAKALCYLETQVPESENPRVAFASTILQIAGHTPEEIVAADVANKPEKEFVGMMRDAILKTTQGASKARQKIVSLADLDAALASGWVYKAELRDSRILVEAA